jgi:hypothetical protein
LDHAPHVVVYIIHLNSVRNFFLVEFGPTRKDIDILIVEDARGCGVTSYVQIRNTTPRIILDVILLTSGVKRFGIITADDKDKPSFRIKSRKVTSFEE